MPDTTFYPTTTIDASPATLPCEGEVAEWDEIPWLRRTIAAERYISDGLSMACCKLKVELSKRDSQLEEVLGRAEEWQAKADAANATIAKLSEANNRQCDTIMEQTRELAERDATIAATAKEHSSAIANLIATANRLSREKTEAQLRHEQELASLRSQLARAEAEGAWCRRLTTDVKSLLVRHPETEAELSVTTVGRIEALRETIATSPAIDPAGTLDGSHTHEQFVAWAEGQRNATARLAILERVAIHARDYGKADGWRDSFQDYHLLRLALAELDKLEAAQCPSR